jgi:DNA-binding beta-propeller fold protein YncE
MSELRTRASRLRRARIVRSTTAGLVALAAIAASAVLVFGGTGARHGGPVTATPRGPYLGTATVAFASPSGVIYLVDQSAPAIVGVDPASRPPFARTVTIPLPFTPGVLAVTPDGTRAIVAPDVVGQGGSGLLYEVDLSTHRIIRRFVDAPDALFGNIVLAPNGRTAYAWADNITPVDLDSGALDAPIVVNAQINDFVLSPSGQQGTVAAQGPGGDRISQVDLSTGKVIRIITTSGMAVGGQRGRWIPEYVAYGPQGSVVYVALQRQEAHDGEQTGVVAIDQANGRVVRSLLLPGAPAGMVVSPDGRLLSLLQSSDQPGAYSGVLSVTEIGLDGRAPGSSLVVRSTVALGDRQSDVLMESPTGTALFVVTDNWSVITVDTRTNRVGPAIRLPGQSLLPTTLQPVSG